MRPSTRDLYTKPRRLTTIDVPKYETSEPYQQPTSSLRPSPVQECRIPHENMKKMHKGKAFYMESRCMICFGTVREPVNCNQAMCAKMFCGHCVSHMTECPNCGNNKN